MAGNKTLYDKLVDSHTVRPLDPDSGEVLLYVDRTVLNEYTSPQAFTGLRDAGRQIIRPQSALAVIDHVNSTRPERIAPPRAQADDAQMSYFVRNCADFGIELFDLYHRQQGIEWTSPGLMDNFFFIEQDASHAENKEPVPDGISGTYHCAGPVWAQRREPRARV